MYNFIPVISILMFLKQILSLIILSLLSLMEGSTTTSTPDLLLVVLLFLEHLSALSVVLLKTELGIIHLYDDLLWQDDT